MPTCRELGIGFVPYSPLGRGFLTGRFQARKELQSGDFRANLPRFSDSALHTNRRIAQAIGEFAVRKNCTLAQLSLAWLLSKGKDIVPIPGTKQIRYLEENAAAVDITLTDVERLALESAIDKLPVQGARYTEEGMKGVDV